MKKFKIPAKNRKKDFKIPPAALPHKGWGLAARLEHRRIKEKRK